METASLQLPKDMIEAAIQREISLSIAKSLGDSSRILDEVVKRVLTQKVDSYGKPSSYSSNPEFISWAVDEALREAVKKSLREEIGKYGEIIKKNIADRLAKKNSPLLKQLVEGMTKGIVSALEDGKGWQLKVIYGEE